MNLEISGLGVLGLVIAVVEGLKSFGLESTLGKQISALSTGVILTFVAYGIHEQLIPAHFIPYINWGVYSLAGGLAAMGVYDFGKRAARALPRG